MFALDIYAQNQSQRHTAHSSQFPSPKLHLPSPGIHQVHDRKHKQHKDDVDVPFVVQVLVKLTTDENVRKQAGKQEGRGEQDYALERVLHGQKAEARGLPEQ